MLTAAAIRCKLSLIRLYRIKAALDFKCRLNKVSQDYHTNHRFEIRDAMRSNSFVHYYTINIIIVVVSVHGQVKSRVECWEDEAICCEMEIGFPFIIDTVLSRFCIACLWVGGRSFVLGIASSSKVLLFRCLCMFLMFADPRNEWACYMPIAYFSGSDFPNNYHRSKNGNCNWFRVQCNSCFAPNDSTLESNHKLTTNNSISGGFI